MKALSFLQPWADAVLILGKDIENRSWSTKFRGDLVVHCSLGWDKQGEAFLRKNWCELTPSRCRPGVLEDFMATARARRGGFAGLVRVNDCLDYNNRPPSSTLSTNPWAFGPYCWPLDYARPSSNFLHGKGRLGFFEFKGDLFSQADGKPMVLEGSPR